MEPTTPGWQTSEFLLTVLGVASLVLLVLTGHLDGQWAAGAIAVPTLGYQVSRGLVKAKAVAGDAQVDRFRAELATYANAQPPATPRTRSTR